MSSVWLPCVVACDKRVWRGILLLGSESCADERHFGLRGRDAVRGTSPQCIEHSMECLGVPDGVIEDECPGFLDAELECPVVYLAHARCVSCFFVLVLCAKCSLVRRVKRVVLRPSALKTDGRAMRQRARRLRGRVAAPDFPSSAFASAQGSPLKKSPFSRVVKKTVEVVRLSERMGEKIGVCLPSGALPLHCGADRRRPPVPRVIGVVLFPQVVEAIVEVLPAFP